MKYRLAGASYRAIAEKLTEERAQAYADANSERRAKPEAENTGDRHHQGQRLRPCPVAHGALGQRA